MFEDKHYEHYDIISASTKKFTLSHSPCAAGATLIKLLMVLVCVLAELKLLGKTTNKIPVQNLKGHRYEQCCALCSAPCSGSR